MAFDPQKVSQETVKSGNEAQSCAKFGYDLRLNRCPKCGYDITMLPRNHRCPECGFVFEETMFDLPAMRSNWRAAWWALFLLNVLYFGLAMLGFSRSGAYAVFLAPLFTTMCLGAYRFYRMRLLRNSSRISRLVVLKDEVWIVSNRHTIDRYRILEFGYVGMRRVGQVVSHLKLLGNGWLQPGGPRDPQIRLDIVANPDQATACLAAINQRLLAQRRDYRLGHCKN